MLNMDPILLIPCALADLVNKQQARLSFVANDRQLSITIEQVTTGRPMWQVRVLERLTALTWHISEYSDVVEIRHQGIASEFCERLIQQAEDAGIKYITAHCSADSAAFFIQMFGAIPAKDVPPEQRVNIFGRAGLDDGPVSWNLESSLAIFIRCTAVETIEG